MQVRIYTWPVKVSELFLQALKRKNWKPVVLARKTGIDPSTIGRILRGESRGSSDYIARITDVLEIDPVAVQAALREDRGYAFPVEILPEEPSAEELLRRLQVKLERERESNPVFVYPLSDQRLSAGPGAPIDTPFAYYPREGERGHRFVWVKVSGDCMEPDIHEGNIVVVDLDASPVAGKIVAAMHEGEALVKKLEQHNGDLYLVAVKKRPPIRVTGETKILGVVTFHGNWV